MCRPLSIIVAGFGIGIACCAINATQLRADVFVLADDGQLTGELVNKDESPRKTYVVRTDGGAVITLDRLAVKHVVQQNAAELEYDKIRPTFADTAEDQWRLAEWCREKSLPKARQAALERVIELDPQNRQARIALGYNQIDGRWVQREQWMQEQGKILYEGNWIFPQEKEIRERRKSEEKATKEWYGKIKQIRTNLENPARADAARDELHRIDDPTAVPALQQALRSEDARRDVRAWYVEALGRLGTKGAIQTLVNHSLEDPDLELRLTCIDQLKGKNAHEAAAMYVGALRNKDNATVNQAGFALGKLGDKSAIPALIDALVTTHTFTVQQGNPGQIGAGFSPSGGGGLSVGSTVKRVKKEMQNQAVLDALATLAGGANFGFDERAWKNWYAQQTKPREVDSRRDGA